MTLRQYIRVIVMRNSGGIKLAELMTKVTAGYYEREFKHPGEVTAEDVVREADKDFGILYYSFEDRDKIFIYQR